MKDYKGAIEDFAEAGNKKSLLFMIYFFVKKMIIIELFYSFIILEKQCPEWALIYFNRANVELLIGKLEEAEQDLTTGNVKHVMP